MNSTIEHIRKALEQVSQDYDLALIEQPGIDAPVFMVMTRGESYLYFLSLCEPRARLH